MEEVRDISRKIWDALIKEDFEVIRHYAHKEAVHPFVVTEVYTKDENSIKLASWAYTRITY